jgi:hypothetical protein
MTREEIEAVMASLLDAAEKLQALISDCQAIADTLEATAPE